MVNRRENTSGHNPFPVALSYRLVDYMGTDLSALRNADFLKLSLIITSQEALRLNWKKKKKEALRHY